MHRKALTQMIHPMSVISLHLTSKNTNSRFYHWLKDPRLRQIRNQIRFNERHYKNQKTIAEKILFSCTLLPVTHCAAVPINPTNFIQKKLPHLHYYNNPFDHTYHIRPLHRHPRSSDISLSRVSSSARIILSLPWTNYPPPRQLSLQAVRTDH